MARFQRYLPMLKLKQQQLQSTLRDIDKACKEAEAACNAAYAKFESYNAVLSDVAGVNVSELGQCSEIKTTEQNIAGVNIPVFDGVEFAPAEYSLFGTPVWVDSALADLRDCSQYEAKMKVFQEQTALLRRELTKIVQRVNLFEKVKIPEARDHIRVIRIYLGDEMTAAVGRAKIAKGKITDEGPQEGLETHRGPAVHISDEEDDS